MKSFCNFNLQKPYASWAAFVLFQQCLIITINQIDIINCADCNGDANVKSVQRKCDKFTVEYLLTHTFEHKISDDVDMDPCKSDAFMGDIALPNINYDPEWNARKFNKSFQQELEKMKQEVYNEGLQVEEEGLSDIIRKKTKLPSSETESNQHHHHHNHHHHQHNNERHKNDPALLAETHTESTAAGGGGGAGHSIDVGNNIANTPPNGIINLKTHPLSKVAQSEEHHISSTVVDNTNDKSSEVKATIIDNRSNESDTNVQSVDDNKQTIQLNTTEKLEKSSIKVLARNIDYTRIQSDTKDILDHSGENIVQPKRMQSQQSVPIITASTTTTTTTAPTTTTATPPTTTTTTPSTTTRTTMTKRYGNDGGNGGTLDDIQALTADSVIRKRHRRRRRMGRKSLHDNINGEKKIDTYQMRFERLKDELNRPVITADFFKTKTIPNGTKNDNNNNNNNNNNDDDKSNNDHSIITTTTTRTTTTTTKTTIKQPLETIDTKDSITNEMPLNGQSPNPYDQSESDHIENISKKKTTMDTIKSEITTQLPMIEMTADFERLKELQHHHRITRAATAKKERIWDYGVIPYEIDANFSGAHKALFKQAMRHWENFTCIKFVERNPAEHPNYITFTIKACGCCSFVGKRGNGSQAISIGKNCDKFGIVVHELGHVVGFWHEHTRPDRENHVVIERTNIISGQEYNFNKLTSDDVNSLGLAYDYDSIMHYARNTFSKGTYLDTILPIEVKGKKRPEIGQRLKLSEGDIAQANLLYKCPKCGRTFQENSGSFTSPTYYSSNPSQDIEACEWRITATHGERIVLNITDLDIFKSNNCRSDYLEIRDGYWHKSPVLGRYCGSGKIPQLIQSTGSRMLITLSTTYRQIGHRGFAASYEAVCGGEINLESGGRLESPNYPLDYLPNKECIWKITVEEEYQVALKFQSFEVENHDNCIYDYVEILDGDSPDSKLIGVFCGYKIPPDMRSTGNKMFIKFVSDGSVQKAGFSATFIKELDECELQNHGCEHECINTLGGYQCSCFIGFELHSDKKSCENACGGVIEALNGTLTSPSFPDIYPISKECVWEIIAPEQYRITINFTHFDLEGNNLHMQDCEYDSLSIFSKRNEDILRRHGIFCGSKLPPMVTSEGNAMRIEFRSDNTIQKSGFAAVFFTDIDECAVNNGGCMHECKNNIGSYTCSCHNGYILHENGLDCKEGGCKYEITAPIGQIYSPNYPDYYPPRKDCVWHFTTTPGHRIKLVFNVFEMEPHQECAYDHVAIYNGGSTDSFSLGRFCGSKIPHPISATSNEMFMVFKSDVSVQRGGFAATYSTSCGGSLTATNRVKHFYSHSKYGDYNYDNDAVCDWTIEAEMGRNVQLTFLTFDIEEEVSCSYDYVDVYGGPDDFSAPLFGRYCGSNKPPDIISVNEAISVQFRTDNTMTFKGFSASYVAIDPFEGSEEMNSDSEEMATPFPGYLKSIYVTKLDGPDEDEDDYNEYDHYHNKFSYKKSDTPYNRVSAEQFD